MIMAEFSSPPRHSLGSRAAPNSPTPLAENLQWQRARNACIRKAWGIVPSPVSSPWKRSIAGIVAVTNPVNFVSAATLVPNGGLPLARPTQMPRYRGDIVPDRQWSKWCVSVYATRADLPLFSRSTLRTLAFRKEEAVAAAKQCIDQLLHA
jgi:hypothetical protein